jgi:DNA-binding NarL/FixJ family response regulator
MDVGSSGAKMPSFFIAEDHEICRLALEMTLSLVSDGELIGQAVSGEGLVERLLALNPNVAFIDISLPGANAIQLVKQLKAQSPSIKIVICAGYADELRVRSIMNAGADAFLLKGAPFRSLKAAVESVQRGDRWIDPEVAATLMKSNVDALLGHLVSA